MRTRCLASLVVAFVVVFLLGFALVACPDIGYSIVVRNMGTDRASDVYVAFPGFGFGFRSIDPGVHSSAHGVRGSVPQSATVTWRDENGEARRAEVAVSPPLPRDFRGSVFLDIRDGIAGLGIQ